MIAGAASTARRAGGRVGRAAGAGLRRTTQRRGLATAGARRYPWKESSNYLVALGLIGFIGAVYWRSIQVVQKDDFDHPEVKQLQAELDAQFADRQREKELAEASAKK